MGGCVQVGIGFKAFIPRSNSISGLISTNIGLFKDLAPEAGGGANM